MLGNPTTGDYGGLNGGITRRSWGAGLVARSGGQRSREVIAVVEPSSRMELRDEHVTNAPQG